MAGKSKFRFVIDEFAINSDKLTEEHKQRLDKLVSDVRHTIRLSALEKWRFDLVGSASQTGSDEHNLNLSERRAKAVQAYIEKHLSKVPKKFNIVPVGESAPEDKKVFENSRDRSVGVIARVIGALPVPPLPPPPRRPDPPAMKEFVLIVDSYVTQSIGIGLGPVGNNAVRIAMNFTISVGPETTKYTFKGQGKSAGTSNFFLGGSRSAAPGKPQKFRASARLTSGDFAGEGSLSKSFEFGGSRGGGQFPKGRVSPFEYPESYPGYPGRDWFDGRITEGFKPRVPSKPGPLPNDVF